MEAPASQDELLALDKARQLLTYLRDSLDRLRVALEAYDPLPPWPALEFSMGQVNMQLRSVFEHLQEHTEFLSAAHVYPLPTFPAATHVNMLTELLRKKPEPKVEDWVEEGRRAGLAITDQTKHGQENGSTPNGHEVTAPGLSDAEIEELWDWAAPAGNDVARNILFSTDSGAPSPTEDISTPTARPRPAPQPAAKPMMPLEDILRFISTGAQVQSGPNSR